MGSTRAWLALILALSLSTWGCKRRTESTVDATPVDAGDAAAPPPPAASRATGTDPPDLHDPVVSAPALGWQVVRKSRSLFALHPLVGALVVSVDGEIFEAKGCVLEARSSYSEADGGKAKVEYAGTIVGHWPGNTWAYLFPSPPSNRHVIEARLYRWKGSTWSVEALARNSAAAWSGGRVLFDMAHWAQGDAPTPTFSKLEEEGCTGTLGQIDATAVLGDHVFALGTRKDQGSHCLAQDQSSAVEHFAPGKTEGQLSALPSPHGVEGKTDGETYAYRIAARAPDDVTVAGFVDFQRNYTREVGYTWPYLAHFDGVSWKLEKAPPTRMFPVGVAQEREGTVWIATSKDRHGGSRHRMEWVDASDVWRREPKGPWQKVRLPDFGAKPTHAFDVAVDAGGGVWVSAGSDDQNAVLCYQAKRDAE